MESEKSAAQKIIIETLTNKLHYLEHQRNFLAKFIMDEKNAESVSFPRAKDVLSKLNLYIKFKRDELNQADDIWLAYQLDDLEEEICQITIQ